MATTKVRTSSQVYVDASLDVNSNKIVNLSPGTVSGDAVEYAQMNSAISAALTGGATGSANIVRGTYRYDYQVENVDTVGDWRTYADENGFYTQSCIIGADARGEGVWLTSDTILPAEDINGGPSQLVASVNLDTQINLNWDNGSTNEEGIIIERSADGNNFAAIHFAASGVDSYSDVALNQDTTYYYRVRAFKGTRLSDYSNVASDKTSLNPDFDGAVVEMWDFTDVSGAILADTDKVASFIGKKAVGTFTAAGIARPTLTSEGLVFDGIANTMGSNNIGLNNTMTMYAVLKINDINHFGTCTPIDGLGQNSARIYKGYMDRYKVVSGGFLNPDIEAVGKNDIFNLITLQLNGASSYFYINQQTKVTGSTTGNPGGLTLGSCVGVDFANCTIKGIICRAGADSDDTRAKIEQYLINKYKYYLDTHVMWGQSNMIPTCLTADGTDAQYKSELTNGFVYDRVNAKIEKLSPGVNTGSAGESGVETSYIKLLATYKSRAQYLIKEAKAATSLAYGVPATYGSWSDETDSDMLNQLLTTITAYYNFVIPCIAKVRFVSLIDYQGESDATRLADANAYYDNYKRVILGIMVDHLKAIHTSQGITFEPIVMGTHFNINSSALWGYKAEQKASKALLVDDGVILVNTDDLALQSDLMHTTTDSSIEVGIRHFNNIKDLF